MTKESLQSASHSQVYQALTMFALYHLVGNFYPNIQLSTHLICPSRLGSALARKTLQLEPLLPELHLQLMLIYAMQAIFLRNVI